MMTKKILVTGGAGFIASHIVDKLVEEGHSVRILDNFEWQVHSGKLPDYLNKNAELIKGDVRNESDIKRALEDIEVVFHEAAAVGVGQSMYEIEKYVQVNTGATAKFLDVLVNGNYDVEKFIVASSMSIYGEGMYECENCGIFSPRLRADEQMESHEWEMRCPKCNSIARPIPTNEDKPLFPTSVYAISKMDQELLSLSIGRAYGIPTVALRYFNVYGPRQSLSNPYTGVAAIFSSRIKNGNPPIVYEDGLQTRDFIDVRDIVRANILVMGSSKANYEMFNVGTGKGTSIAGVARTLAKLYGKEELEPKVVNKYRAGDIRHCYADLTKIKKIGFEPEIGFEEGMRALVEWGETAEAIDRSDEAQEELKKRGLVEE